MNKKVVTGKKQNKGSYKYRSVQTYKEVKALPAKGQRTIQVTPKREELNRWGSPKWLLLNNY